MTAEPFRIRPARPEDAPAIAALSGQLGYPASPTQMRQRLEDLLPRTDHALLVAETAGGEVVGWVHLHLLRTVVADPWVEVGGLVVDRAHRRQGIGRRLMGQAETWAWEQNCTTVSLRSNVIRKEAHRFYERLGYRLVKTQLALRKEVGEKAQE